MIFKINYDKIKTNHQQSDKSVKILIIIKDQRLILHRISSTVPFFKTRIPDSFVYSKIHA